MYEARLLTAFYFSPFNCWFGFDRWEMEVLATHLDTFFGVGFTRIFWWFPFFGGFNGSITREWNQLKRTVNFCLIEFFLQGKSPRWDLFKVTCRTGLGAAVGRGCGLRDLSVIHWLTANWAISGGRHDGAGHWFHSKKSLAISEIWFFGKSTGRREFLKTENDKMDGFLSSNNKRNVYLCFFVADAGHVIRWPADEIWHLIGGHFVLWLCQSMKSDGSVGVTWRRLAADEMLWQII